MLLTFNNPILLVYDDAFCLFLSPQKTQFCNLVKVADLVYYSVNIVLFTFEGCKTSKYAAVSIPRLSDLSVHGV